MKPRNNDDLQRALIEAARNSDDELLEANCALPTPLLLALVAAVARALAGAGSQIDKGAV
ncbi:MAG: hypothetical protein ACLQUT_06420 [Thermoleophilia bacterium]